MAHRLIFLHLLLTALAIAGLVTPLVLNLEPFDWRKAPVIAVCVVAGFLGAFVSASLRASRVDHGPRPGWRAMLVLAVASVLVGGVGAAVLYLLTAAGLLEGGLFPRFACAAEARCGTIEELARNWSPVAPADYAKTVLWAFLAGFAERLLPIGHGAAERVLPPTASGSGA